MIERPKLRYVDVFPVQTDSGEMYALRDPSGISEEVVVLSPVAFFLLRFFDGRHSRLDIRAEFTRTFGRFLPEGQLDGLIQELDRHALLDSETYRSRRQAVVDEFRAAPARPASHAGHSYPADPDELRPMLDRFFEPPEGAGTPIVQEPSGPPIRGLIAPHIDLRLGGPTYAHAYRTLVESDPADCFVIIGTGHNGIDHLFSALDKDFETPLGRARCDHDFLRELARRYDGNLFEDILSHRSEHTFEFQVVFLQHVLAGRRDFTIVPLLSSFSYMHLDQDRFPDEACLVEHFTDALRETIETWGCRVCLIASVDLSHIGPRYGDPQPVDAAFLTQVGAIDRQMLDRVAATDAAGFVEVMQRTQDRYRVCGFSPIYTLLRALPASRGELLKYSKASIDGTGSVVTFASMSFS